ncbi:MAG: NAD(P)-dependent alcohol dehydrogenase [Lentisphaeria bacterium]|nr:NAD(P)-dependent alcohol dehydrogenase [Lentisphaeria bacterium]
MKKFMFIALGIMTVLSAVAAPDAPGVPARGFAVHSKDGRLQPYEFTRHAVGDNDILIDIWYSGICHSDLHQARSDWGESLYPMVPGHEIAGVVTQVGKNVTKFKVGDRAGVGCMVNSCGECEYCKRGEEQYCAKGKTVYTYNSRDVFHDNAIAQGGYSNNLVVSEKFAIKIPAEADMARVAPLLCAGITTYSPLMYTQVGKEDKLGIAGFGGLGHMAVRYAVALGADVTVFDITEAKRADALKMGAKRYVNVNNPEDLKGLDNSFRVILSLIPAQYDVSMYLKMLSVDGEMVIVGLPAVKDAPTVQPTLMPPRRKLYSWLIGGIPETQKMLDYSVSNNIYAQVEIIRADADAITEAWRNMVDGKVRFRYVIDMKTMK